MEYRLTIYMSHENAKINNNCSLLNTYYGARDY